ncbi:MAG: ADP-forming succinate--CoA ligase subunit beta [Bacteriovoracaceae bacterium]|nr:ADP-forming succinate--CoA ligase subunit beta [Bacteriovoracaceae bacterium]
MNIHEYQAKQLFKSYGINVPNGQMATTKQEAVNIYTQLNVESVVVKAQAHTGGRGKAGGVKLVSSASAVEEASDQILGMTLVTKQTGAEGKLIEKVLVEETSQIEREIYLSLLVDRETANVVCVASKEGGTEIEELAEHSPEKIAKEYISIHTGIRSFHINALAKQLEIPKPLMKEFRSFCQNLYYLFITHDCSMVEINPLVITKDQHIIALDGKVGFDDNALYRHSEIQKLRDEKEEDPREAQAAQEGFSYVSLDGNIGCMVNGAGLAMGTMDMIKSFGGEPANFLDVGGSADAQKVASAFKLILSDESVKAVLVNIFGGIMKCDVIAEGLITAVKELNVSIPLVVRLEGTNVEIGKKILENSGLKIQAASTFAKAARQVVQLANQA